MPLNRQNLSSIQQETFIARVLGSSALISFGPAHMSKVWLVVGQATGMSVCSVSHPPVGYLKQALIAVSSAGAGRSSRISTLTDSAYIIFAKISLAKDYMTASKLKRKSKAKLYRKGRGISSDEEQGRFAFCFPKIDKTYTTVL